MYITMNIQAPASLWILSRHLILAIILSVPTVLLVDGLLSFTLPFLHNASISDTLYESSRFDERLRLWKRGGIITSGILSFIYTLAWKYV